MSEQTYTLGGGERGLWLGLGPARVAVLGAAVLVAVLLAYAGAPLPFAALTAAAGAGWCFASIGGVSLHEWCADAATHGSAAVIGHHRWRPQVTLTPADGRVQVGRPMPLRGPAELGRLVLVPVSVDGIELGLAAERGHVGWAVTGVFATSGLPGFGLAEPQEQARLLAGWADVLGSLAGEHAGRCRIQWVERSGGQACDDLGRWTAEHAEADAGDYLELLGTAASQATRHETLLAFQITTGERDLTHATRAAESVHRLLAERLAAAELVPQPLDMAGLALCLRQASDPAARAGAFRDGVRPAQVAPVSRTVAWNHLRTDDTLHRAFLVTGWPRVPVGAAWLAPLLVSGPAGVVRTVAAHFEAVAPAVAARRARARRQGADLDSEDRQRLGFGIGARERRMQAEAAAAEADLAGGFVQHRVAAVVVVTAGDLATLDGASREVRASASSARLDLRPLHGRHADGWAASLPLCRLRHRTPA